MRRIIHIALSLCVLCSLLSVSAHAAENTYHLEEAGLTVTIPDSLAAFTRDYSPDDPELSTFGLSDEILHSVFYDGNNYLVALDRDFEHEVFISLTDNDSTQVDFENLTEDDLNDMRSVVLEEYNAMGFQVLEGPEVYPHDQIGFLTLRYEYAIDGVSLHVLQYTTVYNNLTIGLTLRSYLGLITEEQEALVQAMVDSVVFDLSENSASPEEPAEAPSASDLLGRIVLTMLITIVIYALPIVIYRHAVRKAPVPRKKAKWITVIYAFAFFFLSSILLFTSDASGFSGFAIILWSFINYRILVSGGTDGEHLPSAADTNAHEN